MCKIKEMTTAHAQAISRWQYPQEYAVYSFSCSEDDISELMNGEYLVCTNSQDEPVGYFCFGRSAQIPTHDYYASRTDCVDIGLGMRPDLCGLGYGYAFMVNGIQYAKQQLKAKALRLVVAAFNKRAIALYKNCGFQQTSTVYHKNSNMAFIVMQCEI